MTNTIQIKCPKNGEMCNIDLDEHISNIVNQRVEDAIHKEDQQRNEENAKLKESLDRTEQEREELKNQLEIEQKGKDEENQRLHNQLKNLERQKEEEYRKKLIERISEEREIGKSQAIQELNGKYTLKEKEKEEKHENEVKELRLHIENLTKRIDEASKQAEITPISIKGEIGENNLEEQLRSLCPSDKIETIAKRGGGADIIHTVIEGNHDCGIILYECKNTKDFDKKWIPKLKEDSIGIKSDFNVIVTKTMPEDNDNPHKIDDVWICNPLAAEGIIRLMRDNVVRLDIMLNSNSDKTNKREELYKYVNSVEYTRKTEIIMAKLNERRKKQEKKKKEFENYWKNEIKEINDLSLDLNDIFLEIKTIKDKCLDESEILIIENNKQ